MRNTHITIICTHGRNLSRYLKDYLKTNHEIKTHAVGMFFKNKSVIHKINNAKVVIFVHPDIQKEVEQEFDLSKKQLICLNVTDEPDTSGSAKNLTGDLWLEYQKTVVYPTLEKQIKKHVKKLQKLPF